MSNIDVSVDDSLTCFGVHWNTSLNAARDQFEKWGFKGITNFAHFAGPLNGNDARKQVVAEAKRQGDGHKYYFVGNYDWGVTRDSAIYKFNYSGYAGHLSDGSGDWEYFAGWSGKNGK